MRVCFDDYETEAYVDHGANASMISRELVDYLKLPTIEDPEHTYQINQQLATTFIPCVRSTASFHFPGSQYNFTVDFIVADDSRFPVSLGRDFLGPNEFTLGSTTVTSPHLEFSIPYVGSDPLVDAVHQLVQEFKAKPPPTDLVTTIPYNIKLTSPPTTKPSRLPSYTIEAEEFMKAELDELLAADKIEPTAPTDLYCIPFVVPKKTAPFFRMVINFKPINNHIDCPNSEFIPIQRLLAGLQHSTIFSTLDLKSAFLQIPLASSSRQYTTFRTRFGYFRYKVLPFGLNISPEVFNRTLTDLFGSCSFIKCYMDDLLIHSSNVTEHYQHLKFVFTKLFEHNFLINFDKSNFCLPQVSWVGRLISKDGTKPEAASISTINSLTPPTNRSELQSLLGYITYISAYIPSLSVLTADFSDLLIKQRAFQWTDHHDSLFAKIKSIISLDLSLSHFDPSLDTRIMVDASGKACGFVLQQKHNDIWKSIEYRSLKFHNSQLNWSTNDKELYAMMVAVETFRHYIVKRVTVVTDHQNLIHLVNKVNLSPNQERWITRLFQFNLHFRHIPGVTNEIADYISRHAGNTTAAHVYATNFSLAPVASFDPDYLSDVTYGPIVKHLDNFPAYTLIDGKLYYKGRLAVPRSQIQSLLDDFHFSEFVGHPGGTRMYQILKHRFLFPRMKKVIQDYVASCEICCRTKSTNQKLGTLGNVPIPRARWQTVAMDIVSGFPETTTPFGETVNSVLLLVDHMSSRTHLYPIHSTASSETIVNILKFFFFPQHGFPTTFCTDRGSVFSSQFFQSFLKAFTIQQFISVTGHHQSNGKAERFIQSLQQYLRTFILDQNSWVNLLPTAEFTINSLPLMVLGGFSPFEIDLGYNPSGVQDFAYQSNATNSANSTRSSFFIWEEMDRLASAAVTSLKAAHGKDKLHYDLNRKDIAIKPGDKVYININHLQNIPDVKNKSLPASLRSKFIGPYEVLKVLSPVNIEVAMPPSSRRPNGIFHISQLRHQKSIQNAEFIAPNGPPQEFKIYTDGSVEMEIDEILGHVKRGKGYALEVKFCDGTVQLVRLKDLLKTAPELTKEYLKRVGLGSVLSE